MSHIYKPSNRCMPEIRTHQVLSHLQQARAHGLSKTQHEQGTLELQQSQAGVWTRATEDGTLWHPIGQAHILQVWLHCCWMGTDAPGLCWESWALCSIHCSAQTGINVKLLQPSILWGVGVLCLKTNQPSSNTNTREGKVAFIKKQEWEKTNRYQTATS